MSTEKWPLDSAVKDSGRLTGAIPMKWWTPGHQCRISDLNGAGRVSFRTAHRKQCCGYLAFELLVS